MPFSIKPGATGVFTLVLRPSNSALPLSSVITWTGDGAAADVSAPVNSAATETLPAGFTASVQSAAAPVATSENLTATVVFTDPATNQSVTLTTGPQSVALGSGGSTSGVPTSIGMAQVS